MSVFDKTYDYIKAKDVPGNYKIALHHGPVHNSKTDYGYKLTNESVTIDTFSGFDLGLCGDIHRMQSLQEYSVETKEIDEEKLQYYIDKGWEVV